MEKPVASDVTGVRRVLGLSPSQGKRTCGWYRLQRRHEERYKDNDQAAAGRVIGDINLLRVYWNGNSIWHRARQRECRRWNIR